MMGWYRVTSYSPPSLAFLKWHYLQLRHLSFKGQIFTYMSVPPSQHCKPLPSPDLPSSGHKSHLELTFHILKTSIYAQCPLSLPCSLEFLTLHFALA